MMTGFVWYSRDYNSVSGTCIWLELDMYQSLSQKSAQVSHLGVSLSLLYTML